MLKNKKKKKIVGNQVRDANEMDRERKYHTILPNIQSIYEFWSMFLFFFLNRKSCCLFVRSFMFLVQCVYMCIYRRYLIDFCCIFFRCPVAIRLSLFFFFFSNFGHLKIYWSISNFVDNMKKKKIKTNKKDDIYKPVCDTQIILCRTLEMFLI